MNAKSTTRGILTPPLSPTAAVSQAGVAVRGFEAHVAEDENVPLAAQQQHLGVAPAVGGVGCVAAVGSGSGLVATGGRNGAVGVWDPRAAEPRVAVLAGHLRKNVKEGEREGGRHLG
jgi:hypothetical protein